MRSVLQHGAPHTTCPAMGDRPSLAATNTKRPAIEEADGAQASKKLLQSNTFSSLPVGVTGPPPAAPPKARRQKKNAAQQQQQQEQQQQQHQRKEKCPPIYVHGFPPNLRVEIRQLIQQGLKCNFKLCQEGVKLLTEGAAHYERVINYLKNKQCEFYTHDFPGAKPLKVVLHGLGNEWTPEAVQNEIREIGLKPTAVFVINRRETNRAYRDKLFLVHLEHGTTTMKDLKSVRVVDHTIVEWVRYRTKQREVTQCTSCLRYGHGTKHCSMHPRCNRCGENHATSECQKLEEAEPKCANCGEQHPATTKTCVKRAEFIAIRAKATSKNPSVRRASPPVLNDTNFPAIQPHRRPIPVLPPLQPQKRLAAAAASIPVEPQASPVQNNNAWPSLHPPESRPQPEPAAPEEAAPLYTPEQLMPIFAQLATRLRSCKTKYDQIYTLGMFVIQNGY